MTSYRTAAVMAVLVALFGLALAPLYAGDAPAAAGGGAAAPAGAAPAAPPAVPPAAAAPATSPAAPAAGEPEQSGATPTFFDLINSAGPMGWVIVCMSFIMVSLVIENFVTLRRSKMVPPEVLAELEELFDKQEYDAALELCEVDRCLLTNVVGAGLAKLNSGWTQMETAMSESAEEYATGLYQKVGYLNLLGTVAPMLGLLGTVIGIVQAFMVIAVRGGNPKPAELAEGIYMALVCTALGLSVAIPALSLHFFFRNRVTKVLMEAGAVTSELMERFRPRQ